jgi:hypothetical protein
MRLYMLLLCAVCALRAQTADEIIKRVAENQDVAASGRTHFIYHQNVLVRLKRTNGKLAHEETRDYTVAPSVKGLERTLVSVSGKVQRGSRTVTYSDASFRDKGLDIDRDIVQGMAEDFGKDNKDGVDNDLFPLNSKALKSYRFTLKGSEKFQDHDVWAIQFEPVKVSWDDDDHCWHGEALIDKAEYQPMMITSSFACKIPAAVKVLLGTNVQQIGFKVTYQKFDDGVWFPITYGGEFKFRALFLYARSVGVGLINSDFKRTEVQTDVKYETAEKGTEQ